MLEAIEFINEVRCRSIDADYIEDVYNNETQIKVALHAKDKMIEEIYHQMRMSDIITNLDDIEIRFVKESRGLNSNEYVAVKSVEEIVEYLESTQIVFENNMFMEDNSMNSELNRATSKEKSTVQMLSHVISLGTTADLRATIRYDASTGVINKVTNRSLELSGFTAFLSMENPSTHYYLSPSKKYVKITGDYSNVNKLITPIGAIEIVRKHAYVQFKYNVEKGLYDAKGGFGYSDTSF